MTNEQIIQQVEDRCVRLTHGVRDELERLSSQQLNDLEHLAGDVASNEQAHGGHRFFGAKVTAAVAASILAKRKGL